MFKSKYLRSLAHVAGIGIAVALCGPASAQQAFPNKPIRLIVPYTPGGLPSVIAHLIGQKLTDSWGQPIIVDNRPGGNAIIGTDAVAKAPPDGYTILLIAVAHVVVPHLLKTPYDPIRDFTPITTLDASDQVLLVNHSVPANTLQELIALAKSRPGQLSYASAGIGSSNHLSGELFKMMTGVNILHVPYKGSGQAISDLLGGQVQMTLNNPLPVAAHVKSGKLKAIAMSGDQRSLALPQVPTFAEAGLAGFAAKNWHGVLAPAGTPKEIAAKLSSELGRIMAAREVADKFVSQGVAPFVVSLGRFAALLKADQTKWGKVIKAANIRIDN